MKLFYGLALLLRICLSSSGSFWLQETFLRSIKVRAETRSQKTELNGKHFWWENPFHVEGFIHSFIQAISIAPLLLQVHYYSGALPTQHGYCVGVSRRSATLHRECSACPRSLRVG